MLLQSMNSKDSDQKIIQGKWKTSNRVTLIMPNVVVLSLKFYGVMSLHKRENSIIESNNIRELWYTCATNKLR